MLYAIYPVPHTLYPMHRQNTHPMPRGVNHASVTLNPLRFSIREQLLHINVQRLRGGLVLKALRRCESLHSRLDSNKEEGKKTRDLITSP